jgi:hypothetical protein
LKIASDRLSRRKAALAKAARMKLLARRDAAAALRVFNSEWEAFVRLQMTEVVVSRAASLAWQHDLRGYDAAHLASALFWQDMLGEPDDPPHVHARYGEHEVRIEIESGRVMSGRLPRRVRQALIEWVKLRRVELLADWELARARRPLRRIEPLL